MPTRTFNQPFGVGALVLVGAFVVPENRSYIKAVKDTATVPVMVVLLVAAPALERLTVLVNVPKFDPVIFTHKKAFDELLAINTVFVNAELLVDTCQLVESDRATVMLVVKFDAVTRKAELTLG